VQFGIAIPTYRIKNDTGFIAEAAQAAEELGYYSIWFADHLAIPQDYMDYLGPEWYEPVVTASYLAARTKRVKLGWDVIILAYRNPIVLAKMIATLDVMSQGRVIFGAAAGYVPGEFAALGQDFAKRGEVSDEYLKVMKALWTQEDPVFKGKYFQFRDIKAAPKPVQQPHPPVWIGGNSAPAIRRAAKMGDGWHPLYPTVPAMQRGIGEIKRLRGRRGLKDYAISYSCSHVLFEGALRKDKLPERMQRSGFTGSPERIAGAFKRLAKTGVQHATIRLPHQQLTRRQFFRQLERFIKEVAPQVP
jgi:probable F420-dependent oxidoreductase